MRLVVRLIGFEWDEANWRKSELKHGVAAAEAEEALLKDPLCQVDPRHSDDEQRYVALGETNEGRRLFVSFTVRRGRARVISARPMSRKERAIYDEAKKAN
ncbi:MAG: BrnT family toxin [Candidatus Rokubacteria bacterium]|nr:BrnT family toxin [Candidatus Rokubacteria bacterium]